MSMYNIIKCWYFGAIAASVYKLKRNSLYHNVPVCCFLKVVECQANKSDVKMPKNQPGYYTTESLYM